MEGFWFGAQNVRAAEIPPLVLITQALIAVKYSCLSLSLHDEYILPSRTAVPFKARTIYCAVDAKSFWYDLMPKTNQKRAMKIKVKQNKALSLSKNFTNILD